MFTINDVQEIIKEEIPSTWSEIQLSGKYKRPILETVQERVYDSNEKDECGNSPKCRVVTKISYGFDPANDQDYDIVELKVNFMNWEERTMIINTNLQSPTQDEIDTLRKRIKNIIESLEE